MRDTSTTDTGVGSVTRNHDVGTLHYYVAIGGPMATTKIIY